MTEPHDTPRLSAVIACYRDEPAILPMHARLTQVMTSLGVDYEIIFVNDASPDAAGEVLAQLTGLDDHVVVIEHTRNFGSQSAFSSGMEVATGDAVILLDGDLQDPPELIVDFYAKWREGFEVVYGRRKRREGSWLLALLAHSFYRVFSGLAEIPIPLDAGDFALMDRRVVDTLLAFSETDQFLRGLRAFVGYRQTGVDYLRPERAFGRSTHSFAKNFWWAKMAIFSFSFAPLEALGYLAVSMTTLATAGLVWTVALHLSRPEASHATALIVWSVAFFGSLQLTAIALLGQYVIKLVQETKGRPKFIRRSIRHGGSCLNDARAIADFVARRRDLSARPAPEGDGDA